MDFEEELVDRMDRVDSLAQAPVAKKREHALIYIDETQLARNHELSLHEELIAVAKPDAKGRVVETKRKFRGVVVGIVSLSAEEQIRAVERAESNHVANLALLRASMWYINGRVIRHDLEEQDTIFAALGMKGQALLSAGFRKMSTADKEAAELMESQFRFAD